MKQPSTPAASAATRGTPPLKLTALSSCAGCAAKLGQAALQEVLRRLPPLPRSPNLLVDASTADDAGVFRLNASQALVQTVDFFTPIVDDPFAYGQIAAANALSDVYAMGGRPLTALNLLGVPADLLDAGTIAEILRGGLAKARESGCTVVGGHTIRLPEPVYGMAVTGLVSPRRIIANSGARRGDWLVLTKPLGTGIVTTAIKRGLASETARRRAIRLMSTLNLAGAELGEAELVRAGTDVTGFGLLGHLANLCRGSGLQAEIDPLCVPPLADEVLALIEQDCIPGGSRQNLETAGTLTDWGETSRVHQHLLTDAQTSGGLLVCVSDRNLAAALGLLRALRTPCAAVIGRMTASGPASIRVRPGSLKLAGGASRTKPVRSGPPRSGIPQPFSRPRHASAVSR